MVHVIEDKLEGGELHVTLESDAPKSAEGYGPAIEELGGTEARNLALKHSLKSLKKPGISGQVGPYPVNGSGVPVAAGEKLAGEPKYRVTYRIADAAI